MYWNRLKLLQTILLVWVVHSNGSKICREGERQALMELKKGLVDDFGILSSWVSYGENSTDCCSWWGVVCGNRTGHVVELDLHARDFDKPLRGEISASLVQLHHLNSLDFSWNDFHGNPIPQFLASLPKLRILALGHAHFGGEIPYQLGRLSALQILRLQNNYLVGEIPWQLGNLSNLLQLNLHDNHLGGIIPHQLGNLSTLEVLYLGSNDNLLIEVEDISWISRLSSLTDLQLDGVSNLHEAKNWLHIVGQLPNLQLLFLENCSLSDMDLLFVHPSVLNFSNSLTDLILSYNKFTASIFPWLFHFNSSSLGYLDLQGNLLEGPIPYDLGKIMISLYYLGLANNQLNGTLPKTIANLLELQYFDLSGNSLEGEITNLGHLANLTNLKLLSVSQNSFTLKFNDNWVPQFQLESLTMQSCTLGSSFPKWLQTQNDLYHLDVANTGISDTTTMASFLCSAKESLTFLNMSSNHFKGQLPDCWDGLKSITIIDFSNNEFSGNIPTSMGSLISLRHLILRNNHFIGELPSLKNCTNLIMLDVGRNQLSGPIPSWIASNFLKLQVLSLTKNNFFESLPLNLCHLSTIQVLDLSVNNFTGSIPKCLQNFTMMTQKPVTDEAIDQFFVFKNGSPISIIQFDFFPIVRWKGKELSFKDNKRLLRLIDLSENHLSSKIPKEIGSLSELVSLDLSNNNLNGEIPWEIGHLHALDFLDLSTNHLSGTIPSSLSEIDRLAVLNLSNNNLSGKIPSGTQLQGFDVSVYAGNPYLCGSPLERICPDDENEKKKKAQDSLTIEKHEDSFLSRGFYISMGLGFATGFSVIFGSLVLFPSWRHAYFNSLYTLYDTVFVITVINISRSRNLFKK